MDKTFYKALKNTVASMRISGFEEPTAEEVYLLCKRHRNEISMQDFIKEALRISGK